MPGAMERDAVWSLKVLELSLNLILTNGQRTLVIANDGNDSCCVLGI